MTDALVWGHLKGRSRVDSSNPSTTSFASKVPEPETQSTDQENSYKVSNKSLLTSQHF